MELHFSVKHRLPHVLESWLRAVVSLACRASDAEHSNSVMLERNKTLKCTTSFAKDEVRVVVEQPADGVGKDRYNSAHRQCLLHMVASPPSSFDCETSGKFSSPRTEVVLKPFALEQLPLLKDIVQNTDGEDGTSTELDLPCSVWGLVSLLLLLEGSVKLRHWFGGDCDPSLPAQTLLAAEFLGCKASRDQVLQYLKDVLIGIAEYSQKNLAAQASSDVAQTVLVHQPYSRAWHSTQVLRQLPMNHSVDVFSEVGEVYGSASKAVAHALCLPQDLLARWVASAAPVLDLRSAQLTALQWARLFTAIAQGGDTITELHVCGTPVVHQEAPPATASNFEAEVLQYNNQQTHTRVCNVCNLQEIQQQRNSYSRHGYQFVPAAKQGVGVVALCTHFTSSCRHVDHIDNGPHMPAQDLCKHFAAFRRASEFHLSECSHMLNTLAGVLPQFHSLQHVGLHNLALQPQLMPALGQVLLDLPPSVTTLTLTVSQAIEAATLVPLQRSMLFSAIALVRGLRELHMPDWEVAVGTYTACLEPLYGMPHLEVVYVPVVKNCGAFPVELTFKALQVAPTAGASPTS